MRLLILLLVGLLLLLHAQLWSRDGGLLQVWQLQEALAEQQARNEQLRQRNAALDAEVRDLKDGLDALEERARSELGMIREGEIFYQVVEP